MNERKRESRFQRTSSAGAPIARKMGAPAADGASWPQRHLGRRTGRGRSTLNAAWMLLVGMGLGLRHALDADHVVVVSTLLERERSAWRAARIAASWGAGHTAAFLGLGLLIVHFGVQLPASFDQLAELLVGVMLVYLGALHLLRPRAALVRPVPVAVSVARPLLVGLIHGLAGSAGIALVAASTVSSRLLASAYLVLFGLGTILGMVALTVVLSRALAWSERWRGHLGGAVASVAAWLSLGLGLLMLLALSLGAGLAHHG